MQSVWNSCIAYLTAGMVGTISTLSNTDGAGWLLILSVAVALLRLIIDVPVAYRTVKGWYNGSKINGTGTPS